MLSGLHTARANKWWHIQIVQVKLVGNLDKQASLVQESIHENSWTSALHHWQSWKQQASSPTRFPPASCIAVLVLIMTRITQVWALMGSVWFLVLSSWVTKIVLKITWLLDQWLGPTFPMDLVCIRAYLGCIQECSGFPSSTPMFPPYGTQVLHDCAMICNVPIVANIAHCMTMRWNQCSDHSKYRTS